MTFMHFLEGKLATKMEPALLVQYIPRNMHTVFALLCFVVVIHWLIVPYPSGLLHWHCGNLTIAPVPAKQPWWIWINTSCESIMNDCITTTKQSTNKTVCIFLGIYCISRWFCWPYYGCTEVIRRLFVSGIYHDYTERGRIPLFNLDKFRAMSIVKIPKYRHCFHHCSGYH